MRVNQFFIVVAVLAGSQFAEGGSPGEHPVQRTEHCRRAPFLTPALFVDGRSKDVQITAEDIESSPIWDPASGTETPLSAAQATRLGVAEFRRQMGSREGWHLLEVVLRPLCDGHWIYSVDWSASGTDEVGNVMVSVLLSGKVVSLDRASSMRTDKR